MTIQFTTDDKVQQCQDNLVSVLSAIKRSYKVPHEEWFSEGKGCYFGALPIKECCLEHLVRQGVVTLTLPVDVKLFQEITNVSCNTVEASIKSLYKKELFHEANTYGKKFIPELNKYFGINGELKFKIDTHSFTPSISIVFDITNITNAVINAISKALQHSRLTPVGIDNKSYSV